MPIWAPFVEEGDFQGLMDAIDVVVQKNPRYLLHGHEPLTRNFTSASLLAQLKTDLTWLREQVLTATRRGDERGAIHQANLLPPGLLNDQPDVYQPYLSCANTSSTVSMIELPLRQPDLQGSNIRADRRVNPGRLPRGVGEAAGRRRGTFNADGRAASV